MGNVWYQSESLNDRLDNNRKSNEIIVQFGTIVGTLESMVLGHKPRLRFYTDQFERCLNLASCLPSKAIIKYNETEVRFDCQDLPTWGIALDKVGSQIRITWGVIE